MYRILLADDEGIMLESLKNIIESNYGEECEIACAKTGRAVVELAETFRPDIAFMDIQMPGLNGIQAMKEIRKFNQGTLFIVITAYDQFDYAKEAINLGVLEYLTKPVNKRVVLDVLMEAMKKVDNVRQKRSDDLKIREKLETVVPMLESGLIYNILLQEDYNPQNDNYLELLGIEEDFAFMMVIPFGEEEEDGILTNAVGISVKAQSFYNEFREIAKGYFHCIVGPIMGNRIMVLVPWLNPSVEYEERLQIIEKARNFVHKLENKIDAKFRIGIGTIQPLADIRDSYQEAIRALHENKGHIVHVKDLPIGCSYAGNYPVENEKRLFQMIARADTTGAKDQAGRFFQWMVANHSDDLEDIQTKCLEFVLRAERDVFLNGGMEYSFEYRKDYLKNILNCGSDYTRLREWFLDKIEMACKNMANKKQQPESVISKAKEFIKENYQKDISLDDVSREVDISPYYFSKLFKQEAGQNFIEYLTTMRMQNAKELLHDARYSIKEVCVMSGYSDPNYFSRIFKKYEGLTPSEYKERLG